MFIIASQVQIRIAKKFIQEATSIMKAEGLNLDEKTRVIQQTVRPVSSLRRSMEQKKDTISSGVKS